MRFAPSVMPLKLKTCSCVCVHELLEKNGKGVRCEIIEPLLKGKEKFKENERLAILRLNKEI